MRERQMGFAGLLLTDGKAVVTTYGTGHVFYCHGGDFKHIATDYTKRKKLADLGILSDGEEELDDRYQERVMKPIYSIHRQSICLKEISFF